MQDVKADKLELFFDCLDESNNFLYEIFHKPYFQLLEMTVENVLAGEVVTDIEPDQAKALQKIYDKIADIDFSVEDVRKAMQAIILRCFKEMRIPNGNTTPDTIGIFVAYLITKLLPQKKISILDPLCGTGNLLLTISNHLDKECVLYACDHDEQMTKLTKMTSDLLNTPVDIYLEDTFQMNIADVDSVVFDMPHMVYEDNQDYFPYQSILFYSHLLKEDGCMIGIVENDFFDYDKHQTFKKELLESMTIIGLVELPDQMFLSKPKIVLVLQKKIIKDKKCFMVKLPGFTDVKEFNASLIEIETWFENNK